MQYPTDCPILTNSSLQTFINGFIINQPELDTKSDRSIKVSGIGYGLSLDCVDQITIILAKHGLNTQDKHVVTPI